MDVEQTVGAGVVRPERRLATLADDQPGEADPVHGREPEAGGHVVHVAGVEAVGEQLARERRARARRAKDEDEGVVDADVAVELELARLEIFVERLQEALVLLVLRVPALSLAVEVLEARAHRADDSPDSDMVDSMRYASAAPDGASGRARIVESTI